jgi:hypothetical protein
MAFRGFRHHYKKLELGRQVAIRALVAFIIMFSFLRALTYVIHYQLLPIGNLVTKSGLHIHHLFWGILLLMVVGFSALATRDPKWHLRIAVIFGAALALTLDEFALWLRLADVYWEPVGKRESLTAAFTAAAFLALFAVGMPFWRGVLSDLSGKRRTQPASRFRKAS